MVTAAEAVGNSEPRLIVEPGLAARVAAIISANEPSAARAAASPAAGPRASGLLADAQPVSAGSGAHVKAP